MWVIIFLGGYLESTSELFDSMSDALMGSTPSGQIEFNKQQQVLIFKTRFLSKTLTWAIQLEILDTTIEQKFDFLVKRVDQIDSRVSTQEAAQWSWSVSHPQFVGQIKPGYELSSERKTVRQKGQNTSQAPTLIAHKPAAIGAPPNLFGSVASCGLGGQQAQCFSFGSAMSDINLAGQGFISDVSLPNNGLSKTFIRIDAVGNNRHIMVGVVRKDVVMNGGCYSKQPGSVMLFLQSGNIVHTAPNGSLMQNAYFDVSRVPIADGDVLSVLFDAISRMLGYELNGFSLGIAYRLPKPEEGEHLCVAVDLFEAGQSVTFI